MENTIYEVYALLDANKCITRVESTAFYSEEELLKQGFIKIDEGCNGEIYAHAQPNYLLMKYGKSAYDEQFRANYMLVDGNVIEITEDQKLQFNPIEEERPSDIDVLKEQQERTDAAVQDLILMMMGGA